MTHLFFRVFHFKALTLGILRASAYSRTLPRRMDVNHCGHRGKQLWEDSCQGVPDNRNSAQREGRCRHV